MSRNAKIIGELDHLSLQRKQLGEDSLELPGIRLSIAGGIGQRHQEAKYRRGSARCGRPSVS